MSIPKPLVQINQLFLIFSILFALIFTKVLLIIPLIVGVITLITKQNPVIRSSRVFLKKPASEYIQEDRDQQLFNQWIATVSLGLALIFFGIGLHVVGYIFSAMVVIAASLALSGYCIGCTIRYRYQQWKYKRHQVNIEQNR